jgi:hypothetical protein
VSSVSGDWELVAEAVRERRHALGLKQTDALGVSPASWRKLEGAKQESYKLFLLRAVERALEWPPGTVEAIASGAPPPQPAPDLEGRLEQLTARVEHLEAQLGQLLDQRHR